MFSFLKAVTARMSHFPLEDDGCAYVIPAGELVHRENVSRLESNVCVVIPLQHGLANRDVLPPYVDSCAIFDLIACQIRSLHKGIASESARHSYQLCSTHPFRHWIGSGALHLAAYRDHGSIELVAAKGP